MKRMFLEVGGPFMAGIVAGFVTCLPIMIATDVNPRTFWHWGAFLLVMLVLMAVMFWWLQRDHERRTCWRCRAYLETEAMIVQVYRENGLPLPGEEEEP